MLTDWEFWLAVIPAVIAIAALFLNFDQRQLSNRQSLFDRRLECYLKVGELMQLYEEAKPVLKPIYENETLYSLQIEFGAFTNNVFLEDIGPVIKNPLQDPLHKKFLIKCAELKSLSIQIPLIFNGTSAERASSFVSAYEQLLYMMCNYQVFLDCVKDSMKIYLPKKTYEEVCKINHEPTHREELLKACRAIERAYASMVQNKTMENLKKKTKLWYIDWRR